MTVPVSLETCTRKFMVGIPDASGFGLRASNPLVTRELETPNPKLLEGTEAREFATAS